MTIENTSKQMLENSVRNHALTPVKRYLGDVCYECGNALTDSDACAGPYDYDCGEYGCMSNFGCKTDCACAYEEECPDRHDVEDAGCGGTRFNPLDINYLVDHQGELIGVTLIVTVGGPHVEVVARSGRNIMARGWWGSDSFEWWGAERCDDLLDYFDEIKPFTKS